MSQSCHQQSFLLAIMSVTFKYFPWKFARIVFIRYVNYISSGPRQAKKSFQACANCADSHHPGHAQNLIRTCSPLKHSILFNDFAYGQQRSSSDCADAQSDLGLRCIHMSEDTFLLVYFSLQRLHHGPFRLKACKQNSSSMYSNYRV